MTKDVKNMSVRDYNNMLKKRSKLNEPETNSEIEVCSGEAFNERTAEPRDEFEGLCREPTEEKMMYRANKPAKNLLVDGLSQTGETLHEKKITSEDINDFIEDIYDLRKESMEKEGEYGLGNLVFKEMRNLGYLDHLKELKNELKSEELSLENLNK